MTTPHTPPQWAFEFHGHRCPFMPIGYRMGKLAMLRLGVEREKDHGFYVVAELGEGHPQTCMMDGIQAATGATYGKLLLSRTFWGKLAAVFAHPEKGTVRYALNADFMDEMGKHEFFSYRKRGIEPSEIAFEVTDDLVKWIAGLPDETIFKVEDMPGYVYAPVKGSFDKTKCSNCGEYVFDRYIRTKDGAPVCIPCSGVRTGAAAAIGGSS